MPLFSSLYTGVSGLRTSQIGINTTAHNLANIYTEGYVRQRVSYADAAYQRVGISALGDRQQVGLGVVASETRHIRDLLLDRAYREQAGRENFYSAQADAIDEVETIMGELNQVRFQASLTDLWQAISELAKAPDGNPQRAGIIMYAEEFITRVNAIGDQLVDYQYNLNQEVVDTVATINSLADQIYQLNLVIQGVEAPNVEAANDYRDMRDLALDQLSQLIDIVYVEDEHGFVTVRAEGQEFITTAGVFHMGTAILNADHDSVFLSPVWQHLDGEPVFNLTTEISTAKNNDLGKLKGLLLARGGFVADYTDIPVLPEAPKEEDFTDAAGNVDTNAYNEASREYWTTTYPEYLKQAEEYNRTIGVSTVMKTQAMFDRLINSIVTMINDKLCPNTDTTITAGTSLTIAAGTNFTMLNDDIKEQLQNSGQLQLDDKGNLLNDITFTLTNDITVSALDTENCPRGYNGEMGYELFSRKDTQSRYTELTAADGTVYYVYNPYNAFGTEGKYSIGNLEINRDILEDSTLLPMWDKQGAANYTLINDILSAWDEAAINLDPNNITKKDFNDYYQAMIDVLAGDGYIFNAITKNQQVAVNYIEEGRQGVSGVASEEELENLIKFQNAYNANSRFINVVAEMIDTLVNRVGVH